MAQAWPENLEILEETSRFELFYPEGVKIKACAEQDSQVGKREDDGVILGVLDSEIESKDFVFIHCPIGTGSPSTTVRIS